MLNKKIYKINNVTDDLIALYFDCFSHDIIFTKRDKVVIEDKAIINIIFNYYIKYGTILAINHYNKPVAFLSAINIEKVKRDKEAYQLLFNKEKYPEVNKIIAKQTESNYIVLVAVDSFFRNRLFATNLVKHYLRYYNRNKKIFTDIDNKYSLKLFKKLGFEIEKINSNYYLAVKND